MLNYTNVTNGNNLYEIVKSTNDLSSGFLMSSILFSVFFITLIVYQAEFKARFMAASFSTTIIGILALFIGLISWGILIFPILLLFTSIIVYLFTN